MKRFLAFFGIIVLIFVLSVPSFAANIRGASDLRGGGDLEGEVSFFLGGDPWGSVYTLTDDTYLVVKQTGSSIHFGFGMSTNSYTTYQSLPYDSNESYFFDLRNDYDNSTITGSVSITSGFSRSYALDSSTFYMLYVTSTASTPSTYTISFNSNGGSSILSLTGQTSIPSNIQSGYIPTKSNYTFDGWYMDSALTTLAIGGSALSANITLYAKWVSSSPQYYNITYHDDWYTWTDESGHIYLDSASLGDGLASYHDSTQYVFDGWYYDSGFTQIASVGDILSSDIHLYAKLVPVSTQFVTLSIYYNGTMQATRVMALPFYISVQYSNNHLYFGHANCNYSFNYSADTQYYVEVIEAGTNIVYVNRFEVTNPTNYSYNVLSGDNVRINITTTNHSIIPADDIYEISFISGYGSFVAPINSIDGELPSLPASVRYGFRFDGWYYDSSYTLPAHVGDSISADTVLYAKWTFVGDPEELTADPGNVLRGLFTGMAESLLTFYLTVGSQVGFGGITLLSVSSTVLVVLLIYFVVKIIKG